MSEHQKPPAESPTPVIVLPYTHSLQLLPPIPGFSEPRKLGRNGQPLPSARAVANAIHDSPEIVHVKYTHMLMQFAQILDHDMTHAPVNLGE